MAGKPKTAAEKPEEPVLDEASEPERVVPDDDSAGADTPSGAALRKVGAPDVDNPDSAEEQKRRLRYKDAKYEKRWRG